MAETNDTLIYRGDRRFELAPQPLAPLDAGLVELQVVAAGICGSDVHGFAGMNDRRAPGTVMGHEVVGRVVRAGGDVELHAGMLMALWPIVACGTCDLCRADASHLCRARRLYGCTPELRGGFAQRMTVPAANLVPVPAGIPEEWGALIEPLAVGHHAVALAGERLGAVGVIGGGPIGIAVAIAARRQGAQELVVVEPQAERRRKLEALGFEAVQPDTATADLDTVFECVGVKATLRSALEATRPGGTVVCVGVAEPEFTIPVTALVVEERRLLGSSAYTRDDFEAVAHSLGGGDVDFGALIEARTDLQGVPGTFEAYAAGRTSAVKTLVIPREGHP